MSCIDGTVSDNFATTTILSKDERCDEQANMQSEIDKQQTGQLVKEVRSCCSVYLLLHKHTYL